MRRDRYEYVCQEAQSGRDVFVTHGASNEEGIVTDCIPVKGHLVTRTPENKKCCWDYSECEEMSHTKIGPLV